MPRIALRSRERLMDGSEAPDATIPADSYRLDASGLTPSATLRVVGTVGEVTVSRDFIADENGVVGETVQVMEPELLALLPYLGSAEWNDDGSTWRAGAGDFALDVSLV